MTPKQLEQTIRALLKERLADAELRERLEKLATDEISFSGFTWLFGPELYRRNRILFRPFVLSRFSVFMRLPKWSVKRIRWKGSVGKALDAWIVEVDKHDDADLFRRLYEWRLSERQGWVRDERSRAIVTDLVARFTAAESSARRQIVLRKFDLWFNLDEKEACELYSIDAHAAAPYVLRRLKSNWLGTPKRLLWNNLLKLADDRKDEDFRWKLYRKQIPMPEWTRDCLAVCERVRDPAELDAELEKRTPEGWSINLADGFFQLLQKRGRDVFPYITRHLHRVWKSFILRGAYGKMADYAREQGWWDLWAALVRTCAGQKEFNREISSLLENTTLPEKDVVARLLMLAGVSREFNLPGFGLATTHQLDEKVALNFYERFPNLLRGPFRRHIQANIWGLHYPKLLERFLDVGDEEMIDLLASRIITRCGRWGNAPKQLGDAAKLADYYAALKVDEAAFSRRAANVLSQVPAYSIFTYNVLIRENRLARLLFERSAASFLADPRSMADLVEASEIHVMALAYRALGLDDPRACEQAANHLPLLLGTLLRPMQRGTRTLAFSALANAANTPETARIILDRAKDALHLPDVRYPKEKLLGLIAQIIHRWPELRSAREQPVIYERAA
jgi:hypothetical protein